MKKKRKYPPAAQVLRRNKRVSFMLNEEEYKKINSYLAKYKITNRSRWFRETMLSHIHIVLLKDYPTLFGENEMRR